MIYVYVHKYIEQLLPHIERKEKKLLWTVTVSGRYQALYCMYRRDIRARVLRGGIRVGVLHKLRRSTIEGALEVRIAS